MKKLLHFMLLGMAINLAACSKDETAIPDTGTTAQTITVAVPQNGIQTRASAADFGNGTRVNRCILEIYRNGVPYGERQTTTVTAGKATFNLRLVASQTYDFVFWADCSDGGADKHYNTADLTAITVNGDYTGNDDDFDAFFYCLPDYKVEGAFSESVTLKRPFGQLNVKTNDLTAIPDATLRPTDVKVTFSALPTSFNAITGVTGTETATVSYTAQVINAENGELSMDYIWAPADEANLADFSVTFLNNGAEITTNDNFKNIPIRRNYKTNVSGNLLTKQGTIDVTIDPIWDGETPVVVNGAFNVTKNEEFTSLQEAIDGADANDVIRIWGTLNEDISIDKDIKIEGGSGEASAARVRTMELAAGINVICENIELFGSRDFWGESYGAYVADVKSVTFKNCRFTQNPDKALALATAMNATGKLTFDGCFFGAQPMFQQLTEGGSLTILNSDFKAWGAQIEPANYINHTIEGNTFKTVHFTAQSGATDAASLSGAECMLVNELLANNTFVDETKKVKVWAAGFYVNNILPTIYNQTTGTTYGSLTEALAAAQSGQTILASGLDSADELTVPAGVTLDGAGNSVFSGKLFIAQGATLRNLSSEWNGTGTRQAIMVQGSGVTLENLTVTYKGTEAKAEAIVTYAGADDLTVKDCEFTGYWKGMYLNSTKGLVIEGCTFDNMNPFSTDEWDATMNVVNNTFIGNTLWSKAIQLCIAAGTEGMTGTTKYQESWPLALKESVYAILKQNTFENQKTPYIRVTSLDPKWDYSSIYFSVTDFLKGYLKNAQNAFVNPDRFDPSAVEFLASYEGKSNVLHYTLDDRTAQVNRGAAYQGHFYNTQGRHFEVFNPTHLTAWEVSGQIWVDEAMVAEKKPFRSELWTASKNVATNNDEYPMLGIANVIEDAGGIYQSTMDRAVVRIWGENGWTNVEGITVENGWHSVKIVSDGSNVTYYFDGQVIGRYSSQSTPIYITSVMPQAFHYGYKHTDGRWFYENYSCETYFCDINYKLVE